jgi:hypothetical protein
VVVVLSSLFFFFSHVPTEPRLMSVSQSPNMTVSCSLFSLCSSVLLSVVALRTLVVLGM